MPAKAKADAEVGIVVFGKDEAGKPHASVFALTEVDLAVKAAGLMGMQVLRPVSDAAREVAAKLPKGRVFASGRGFVPFVKPKVFEALTAAFADPANLAPPAEGVDASSTTGVPAGKSDLGAADLREGSVVLAPAAPDEGWWEAVVVKIKGDLLTLRWRDYPDEVLFARRRNQLALFDFANAPGAR